MADDRFRNWTFIVYPDSAPSDWVQLLDDLHVPILISPLHDRDINADGSNKKAHWHVIVMFDGKKSFDQVMAISSLCSAVIPQKVECLAGMARYLCHLDNPEKVQYSTSSVKQLCGADYLKVSKEAVARYYLIKEMINFIKAERIIYYDDLVDYALQYEIEWYKCLCDNATYFIKEYLKSFSYKIKNDLID